MAYLSVPQSEKERQEEERKDSMRDLPLKIRQAFRRAFRMENSAQILSMVLTLGISLILTVIVVALVGCPSCHKSASQPLNETPNATVAWTRNSEVAERAITSWNPKDIFNRMRTQTTVKRVQQELEDNIEGHMDCFYIRNNVGTKKPPLIIVCPLKTPTKTNGNDVEMYRKSSVLADGTLISGTIYTVSANGKLQVRQEIQSTSTHSGFIGKKSALDTAACSAGEAKSSVSGTFTKSNKGRVDVESFVMRKLDKSTAAEMDKIKGYAPMDTAVGKLIESIVKARKDARTHSTDADTGTGSGTGI